MKLVWTRSDILGPDDDIITWAFGDESSHFAIEFFHGDDKRYVHSTYFKGRHTSSPKDFYKSRKLVFEMPVYLPVGWEDIAYQSVMGNPNFEDYDRPFFWWLVKEGFKVKILGRPEPTKVGVDSPFGGLCQELIEALPREWKIKLGVNFEECWMPDILYYKLREAWKAGVIDLRSLAR